jgi:hypothetical protein
MSFISILSFTTHQPSKEREATDWLDRCNDVAGTSPNQPGCRIIAVTPIRAIRRKMMLTCKRLLFIERLNHPATDAFARNEVPDWSQSGEKA